MARKVAKDQISSLVKRWTGNFFRFTFLLNLKPLSAFLLNISQVIAVWAHGHSNCAKQTSCQGQLYEHHQFVVPVAAEHQLNSSCFSAWLWLCYLFQVASDFRLTATSDLQGRSDLLPREEGGIRYIRYMTGGMNLNLIDGLSKEKHANAFKYLLNCTCLNFGWLQSEPTILTISNFARIVSKTKKFSYCLIFENSITI